MWGDQVRQRLKKITTGFSNKKVSGKKLKKRKKEEKRKSLETTFVV